MKLFCTRNSIYLQRLRMKTYTAQDIRIFGLSHFIYWIF